MADLTCPLCDWTAPSELDAMMRPDNIAAAPGVAAALGMPTGGLLLTHQHQCLKRDESTLENHLRTHGPQDWLPALMQARTRVAALAPVPAVRPAVTSDQVAAAARGRYWNEKYREAFRRGARWALRAVNQPVDGVS